MASQKIEKLGNFARRYGRREKRREKEINQAEMDFLPFFIFVVIECGPTCCDAI